MIKIYFFLRLTHVYYTFLSRAPLLSSPLPSSLSCPFPLLPNPHSHFLFLLCSTVMSQWTIVTPQRGAVRSKRSFVVSQSALWCDSTAWRSHRGLLVAVDDVPLNTTKLIWHHDSIFSSLCLAITLQNELWRHNASCCCHGAALWHHNALLLHHRL